MEKDINTIPTYTNDNKTYTNHSTPKNSLNNNNNNNRKNPNNHNNYPPYRPHSISHNENHNHKNSISHQHNHKNSISHNPIHQNSNSDEVTCPLCSHTQHFNISIKDNFFINCENCHGKFLLIKCYHCKRRIYYKNNYPDGTNILCPYTDCKKWFSKSSCALCDRITFFRNRNQEGCKIHCPFKDCNKEYSKILCPVESCQNKIVFTVLGEDNDGVVGLNKSNNSNSSVESGNLYSEGAPITCQKCTTKFQKITCFNCFRRLIWLNNGNGSDGIVYNNFDNHLNNHLNNHNPQNKTLIEGQDILCPYSDCGRKFNKLNCPHCHKCNIFPKGNKEIGSKIRCIYKECNKSFNKVFCPYCMRMNVFNNGGFSEGIPTKCVYQNCGKKFVLVNCTHCKRVNYWNSKDYIIGQNVICAYKDCGKRSAKVKCPHCLNINVFPNGYYWYGKTYQCIYEKCKKEFSNFICPGCNNCLNLNSKYSEGSKIVCGIKQCGSSFINMRCPSCMMLIMDKSATYKYGQTIICPYSNCKKRFNYLFCVSCKSGVYFKGNEYKEGDIVKCTCGVNFIFIYTTCCGKSMNYMSNNSNNSNNSILKPITPEIDIKCNSNSCNGKFRIAGIHKEEWNSGIGFYPKAGHSMVFANPDKEPAERKFLESFISSEMIYMESFQMTDQGDDEEKAQKKERDEGNDAIAGMII